MYSNAGHYPINNYIIKVFCCILINNLRMCMLNDVAYNNKSLQQKRSFCMRKYINMVMFY